ncbi:MAG: hypothetical protein KF841_02570 [Phycisphaerae bacterium]|nr:hypothetical protein [Phycisphaerae bacterium]
MNAQTHTTTPSDVGTYSLRPPIEPSGVKPAVAQSAVPTVRVHADSGSGSGRANQRGLFVILLGFAIAMLGVFVAFQTEEAWREFIWPRAAAGAARTGATEPIGTAVNLSWIEWARWPGGVVLLAISALLAGTKVLRFLLSAMLFSGTAYVASGLLESKLVHWFGDSPTLPCLITIGVGLAYLVHAASDLKEPKLGAVIGLLFTGIAGVGVLRGWFSEPAWIGRLGESATELARVWKAECNWGIALLLTVIGVVNSRGRTIHFLNAVILAAMAYYCVHDGALRVFPFEGTDWTPIELRDIAYVPTWRWVMVGELILLSGVLVHLALGVGALTVIFAVAWLGFALSVDREMGRDAILSYSQAADMSMSARATTGVGTPSAAKGPASMLPFLGSGDGRGEGPAYSPEQLKGLLRKATIRISLLYVWIYATALMAGVIFAAGLRMLIDNARARTWVVLALGIVSGAAAYWLWTIWPTSETWEVKLTSWVVPRTHVYAISVVALVAAAVFGARSLSWDSKFSTWLYTASTLTFFGTVSTLVGIAMLIKLTGYGQMPVWAYAAIALGQSLLMWVLLIHQSDRARRGLANT